MPKTSRRRAGVSPTATTYYAAHDGSATGAGTTGDPWSYAKALDGGYPAGTVKPGDTILMRTGTLQPTAIIAATLRGTPGNRITVKPETVNGRVTFDFVNMTGPGTAGTLELRGAWTDYHWLEVTNTGEWDRISAESGSIPSDIGGQGGIVVYGEGVRLFRPISYNAGTCYYAGNQEAPGGPRYVEFIGAIGFYTGWHGTDRDHSHNFYSKNAGFETYRYFRQCISFDAFNHGLQANAGSSVIQERKLRIIGGAWFCNGRPHGDQHGNILYQNFQCADAVHDSMDDISIDGATFYHPAGWASSENVIMGDNDTAVRQVSFTNNRVYGGNGGFGIYYTNGFTVTGNVIHARKATSGGYVALFDNRWSGDSDGDGTPSNTLTRTWDNNAYYEELTSNPFIRWVPYAEYATLAAWQSATGLDASSTLTSGPPPDAVIVEPLYEMPGNANIIIARLTSSDTSKSVNLSTVGLAEGQGYEILDAQNLFGSALASGTYTSASPSVNVSITGTTRTDFKGAGISTPAHTAPEFNVFIVRPTT